MPRRLLPKIVLTRTLRVIVPIVLIAGIVLQYAPGGTPDRWFGWIRTAAAAAGPATCTGPVLDVIDGDTLWMRCNGDRTKVRLDYIDAPEVAHPYWNEPGQPGGAPARSELIDLIDGNPVTLHATGKDDYGRTLGQLNAAGVNLNLALVRNGWAWAYPGYTTARYKHAEQQARNANRGLWAGPDGQRTPPWRFRHRH